VVGRIRQELTRWIPSVGQVGGGKKKPARVTVYTADSLHHSDFDADFLLADEGHELMTDRYAEMLGRYWYSRNFTFTATPDMRLDNAHYRMEGIFGPRIFRMTQQEAEAAGLVAHVFVQWIDVNNDTSPAAAFTSTVARKRHGIWRNQWRNQVVAETVRSLLESGQQVLILVDTIDHALHLRKLLPEATLCYSEGALADAGKFASYQRAGLLTADEPEMTVQRRVMLRQQFERREIMCAIATGVWSTGVSFDSLNVLVRADGGESETASIQLPGRVCRIDPATGKEAGILIDFNDNWDSAFKDKSMTRRRSYNQRGWTQVLPNGKIWTPGTRVSSVK
jgi:superfamily II DNA or RNA helicase